MFLMPMGAVSACKCLEPPNIRTTWEPPRTNPLIDTIIVSWVANSFPRPLVKRSSSIAIANMIGNTATIYGSYMYPSSTGPQYVPGGSTNAVVCLLVAALALVLRFIHIRENKKLEEAERESAETVAADGQLSSGRDQPPVGFRYIY